MTRLVLFLLFLLVGWLFFFFFSFSLVFSGFCWSFSERQRRVLVSPREQKTVVFWFLSVFRALKSEFGQVETQICASLCEQKNMQGSERTNRLCPVSPATNIGFPFLSIKMYCYRFLSVYPSVPKKCTQMYSMYPNVPRLSSTFGYIHPFCVP